MGAFLATYFLNKEYLPTHFEGGQTAVEVQTEVPPPANSFTIDIVNAVGTVPLTQQVDTYKNF